MSNRNNKRGTQSQPKTNGHSNPLDGVRGAPMPPARGAVLASVLTAPLHVASATQPPTPDEGGATALASPQSVLLTRANAGEDRGEPKPTVLCVQKRYEVLEPRLVIFGGAMVRLNVGALPREWSGPDAVNKLVAQGVLLREVSN